jgi:dTMP kinase
MAAIMHPPPRGPLVSVEGISGVGKTYLTSRLVSAGEIAAIGEFSERLSGDARTLGDDLLHALITEAHGEHFLRSGHPGTETLLLIAVKAFDYDQCLPLLTQGRTVFEGRSLDSIAVYQSLITHADDFDRAYADAKAILTLAAQWRPLPDLTILILDDVATAVGRAETRDRRRFSDEQWNIHCKAAAMFSLLAAEQAVRFRVIDRRRHTIDEAVAQSAAWLTDLCTQLTDAPRTS